MRPAIGGDGHVVELAATIIQAINVRTDAGLGIVVQKRRPLSAYVARQAYAALLASRLIQGEGQTEYIDLGSGGGSILVGVGRQSEREIERPLAQAIYRRQELIDIDLDRIIDIAGAREAKLAVGVVIVPLRKKARARSSRTLSTSGSRTKMWRYSEMAVS